MPPFARRGLSDEFMKDLQGGPLSPLLERIQRDGSLCLEIREDYLNVYYRGGNLMKVSRVEDSYVAFFDVKYFGGVQQDFTMPTPRLRETADLTSWLSALPRLKQAMDFFLATHPKGEREVQQQLLRD